MPGVVDRLFAVVLSERACSCGDSKCSLIVWSVIWRCVCGARAEDIAVSGVYIFNVVLE